MEEQKPADDDEKKPDDSPPTAPDPGTGIKGNGPPDGFGLGAGGGSRLGGGNRGNPGSKFGWYAGQVQTRIAEAMRNHRKTRTASFSGEVRIWSDAGGRITRAVLIGNPGEPAVNDAVKNEILTGLQLQEPPPAGMKMPIVLRVKAQRPN